MIKLKNFTTQRSMYGISLAYLAILPFANTTALRNLLLLIVAGVALFSIAWQRERLEVSLPLAVGQVPWALVAWFFFLFLFPIWAVQSDVAWINLKGQWGQSLLAWFVGLSVVLMLGRNGPSLWALAIASALPNFVHLSLAAMAWGGLLGNDYSADISFPGVWLALSHNLSGNEAWNFQRFPWGFRGLDPMHGNLGYAACQAIALFSAYFYFAWANRINTRIWSSALAITSCFLSTLIAGSRGAVLYGVFIVILAALVSLLKLKNFSVEMNNVKKWFKPSFFSLSILAICGFLIFFMLQAMKHDDRWRTMVDKVKIGLLSEKPIDFLCNGVSSDMEARIRYDFSDQGPAYADALISGLKGQDGGRILLMRAGFRLMLENPKGLDGSRHSYQKIIEEKCGHIPVLQFAHSHQGWIDMSLAFGWGGVLIFAWLMFYFASVAWASIRNEVRRPWSFGLFLLATFWILRGFADSVYREHYLQMQAFLLAYLFWRMKLAPACRNSSDVS